MAARDGPIAPPRGIRRVSVQSKNFTIDTADIRVVCFTQTCGALGNSLHYRLQIRRRSGDDTQDFTRGRLLLQRLLEFLEQPDILNRDHSLVGKCFEELDLRRGKGAHLSAARDQCSDEFPLKTKRNGQESAKDAGKNRRWEIILGVDVGNMERAMRAHPAKLWLINTDFFAANGYGYGTNMSPRNHTVPLVEPQLHIINAANPGGTLDDGVEHRLHVRRRAADDAEHFGRCRLMLQGLPQFCVPFL